MFVKYVKSLTLNINDYDWINKFNSINYLKVNQCSNLPCMNGGNCTQTPNGFNCSCPLYYSGPTCQTCKNIKAYMKK